MVGIKFRKIEIGKFNNLILKELKKAEKYQGKLKIQHLVNSQRLEQVRN